MDAKEFYNIRQELGFTQKELARALALSLRAVHSYEQGWRTIVPAVERNLLLLLMFQRKAKSKADTERCWEILNCPENMKARCKAWELDQGELCWYITGTICQNSNFNTWEEKIEACRQCSVFQKLFEKNGKHEKNDSPR